MIKFHNLLENHSYFDIFWKTILERLSINDPPFFSEIRDNMLSIENSSVDLFGAPSEVVNFCRAQWTIPEPYCSWRAIKKEHTRLFLLRDYVARLEIKNDTMLFFELQTMINDKVISGEDIIIENGRIKDIKDLDITRVEKT